MTPKLKNTQEQLVIWQWNCRSINKKTNLLEAYIDKKDVKPDIICIQEAGCLTNLRGYNTIDTSKDTRVSTYAKKDVTCNRYDLSTKSPSAVLVEVIPMQRKCKSFFVLNVYSPPSSNKENFEPLFRETMNIVAKNNVILLGDMNAPHKEWNYNFDSAKGKNLVNAMEALNLHTINDTAFPTRTGNNRSVDTCPDLTIVPDMDGLTTWLNTKENLGSDHDIIEVKTCSDNYRRRPRKQKMTDWNAFREKLGALGDIQEIGAWSGNIKEAFHKATKEYGQENEYLCVDSYLISLWDKKQKLYKRWKKKRHNKKLKLRIRNLDKRARDHASKLANQNWNDFCESLKGTLNTSKTWAIIKGMLNPETRRRETSHQLIKVAHNFKGTNNELILAIKERFELDRNIPPVRRNYQGSPNDLLDREISKEELQQAIRRELDM